MQAMSEFVKNVKSKPHYSYVTRMALELLDAGMLDNVEFIETEPEYGYFTRITYLDGSIRFTYGNDTGLNAGSACDIAKDKDYTKAVLQQSGIKVAEGDVFLMDWWADTIRPNQEQKGHAVSNTRQLAVEYVCNTLGFPVYIKPLNGSKGLGVQKVITLEELDSVLDSYETARVKAAIVEKEIPYPDYRVVMLDGQMVSAYERIPLSVVGDGVSTIRELITKLQDQYVELGRDTALDTEDPRFGIVLGRQNRALGDIPERNERVRLHDISNLSAGGTSRDVSEVINERWVEVARKASKFLNLRLCGVDIACSDVESADGDYAVIEVNAAPGLDHYASSGEEQETIVRNMYAKVLNTIP
jgi:D-alanine-D-alanine ligase-like ATP-grasp enzyme